MTFNPAIQARIAVHQECQLHQTKARTLAQLRAVEFKEKVAGKAGLFREQQVRRQLEQILQRSDSLRAAISLASSKNLLRHTFAILNTGAGARIDHHLTELGRRQNLGLCTDFGQHKVNVHPIYGVDFLDGSLTADIWLAHLKRIVGLIDLRNKVNLLIFGQGIEKIDFFEQRGTVFGNGRDILRLFEHGIGHGTNLDLPKIYRGSAQLLGFPEAPSNIHALQGKINDTMQSNGKQQCHDRPPTQILGSGKLVAVSPAGIVPRIAVGHERTILCRIKK